MTSNGSSDLIEVHELKMHFPVTKGIIFQRQVISALLQGSVKG